MNEGTTTRILLVDDHPMMRRGLRDLLDLEDDLDEVRRHEEGPHGPGPQLLVLPFLFFYRGKICELEIRDQPEVTLFL